MKFKLIYTFLIYSHINLLFAQNQIDIKLDIRNNQTVFYKNEPIIGNIQIRNNSNEDIGFFIKQDLYSITEKKNIHELEKENDIKIKNYNRKLGILYLEDAMQHNGHYFRPNYKNIYDSVDFDLSFAQKNNITSDSFLINLGVVVQKKNEYNYPIILTFGLDSSQSSVVNGNHLRKGFISSNMSNEGLQIGEYLWKSKLYTNSGKEYNFEFKFKIINPTPYQKEKIIKLTQAYVKNYNIHPKIEFRKATLNGLYEFSVNEQDSLLSSISLVLLCHGLNQHNNYFLNADFKLLKKCIPKIKDEYVLPQLAQALAQRCLCVKVPNRPRFQTGSVETFVFNE
ncbi:MAG: hypothetical protein SFY32_11565 [Bacteroidota bacterium]|nr:hypothetical protein [Bacteroidota bacterium]